MLSVTQTHITYCLLTLVYSIPEAVRNINSSVYNSIISQMHASTLKPLKISHSLWHSSCFTEEHFFVPREKVSIATPHSVLLICVFRDKMTEKGSHCTHINTHTEIFLYNNIICHYLSETLRAKDHCLQPQPTTYFFEMYIKLCRTIKYNIHQTELSILNNILLKQNIYIVKYI